MTRRTKIGLGLLATLAGLWAVGRFVVTPSIVLGESMTPTLQPWDVCLLWRIQPHAPHRGDIVMFRTADDPPLRFVKRVLAVAGDAVAIENGQLRINGQAVGEPYTTPVTGWQLPATVVPAGKVFVAGDNREVEQDIALHGLVATRLIEARIVWHTKWRHPPPPVTELTPIPRAVFANPWATNHVLLVGLGDSVTAGFGARPGQSYFDQLARDLRPVLPNLTVTNLAVSGSTSRQHQQRLNRLPVQPTNTLGIVVLTTGGNDLIHDYGRSAPRADAMFGATWAQAQPWIAEFEQRLAAMLDELEQRFHGGCFIFLATIYDPSDGTGKLRTPTISLPEWPDGLRILAAYNAAIARVAERRPTVHVVDVHGFFLGHGVAWLDPRDPRCWYFENVEDPNERGHDALRRLFLTRIVTAFRGEYE